MERTPLVQARARKHWTLEMAAERLQVDVNTVSRWERGRATPHAYNVQRLCEVYGATAVALGLQDAPATEEVSLPINEPQEPDEEERPLDDTLNAFFKEDLTLRLLTIVWNWPHHNTRYYELQQLIMQETEDYDAMNPIPGDPISRRDALRRLAWLPVTCCGLSEFSKVLSRPMEDILTQCASGITACESLSRGLHEDMTLASWIISKYLPTLKEIVKTSSVHRKQAAELTAQALLLKATLSVHTQGTSVAARYAEQADTYGADSGNLPLRLVILKLLAWLYACDKQKKKAVETVLKAEELLKHATIPVSPVIQSIVYSGLALRRAQSGQHEDALLALRRAHETFFIPSSDDKGSTYYDRPNLIMDDGLTYYHMGQYEKALDSFSQVINPETLVTRVPISSERMRVEIINYQALASLKSRKKDMKLSMKLWQAGIQGAKTLQSEHRFREAVTAFEVMEGIWPDEKSLDDLRDLLNHW